MTLDYFYGQAGELFSFYRIPKALFQEPRFQSLSTDAKTLYGILLPGIMLRLQGNFTTQFLSVSMGFAQREGHLREKFFLTAYLAQF